MHLYRISVQERRSIREARRRNILERDQVFFHKLIRDYFDIDPSTGHRVLDFGCGLGEMASYLADAGYSAYGCDIKPFWDETEYKSQVVLSPIELDPYRLPYPDDNFDIVFSTSVFEHVQDKRIAFQEIRRVLKPGGISVHLFPSKWYLPHEPHIRIPLANVLWPKVPRWWIQGWILLRALLVRNLRSSTKEIIDTYQEFCKYGVNYSSNAEFRRLSIEIFGNFSTITDFYIKNAQGRYAKLTRKLPFKPLWAWVTSQFRMNLIFQRKEEDQIKPRFSI